MTIRKRLARSNLVMILIPIAIAVSLPGRRKAHPRSHPRGRFARSGRKTAGKPEGRWKMVLDHQMPE